jgi:hypothetical protein
LPHFGQTVGLRPASSASNPSGKKQIATMITQAGYPARETGVAHLGHVTMHPSYANVIAIL